MIRKTLVSGVALLTLFALLGGCAKQQKLYQAQIYVFGTLATISIWGVDDAKAQAGVAAVSQDFDQMHHDWHAWHPGPLVDLNKAIAAGKPARVLPSLIPLIERSKELSDASEGLFNPAIGRLLKLWGFQSSERPHGPPPSRAAIAALVAQHPSMDDIRIKDGVLYSSNRAVQLDFGADAKGYAVDLALAHLRKLGIQNAIVNAGGGLGVIGSHGDRPWRVGIRHPQGKGIIAAVNVYNDENVHTSGNYERFRVYEGVHYAHILDPRTGWPVEGITSCTVIDRDGTLADAAATALVVAGVKEWQHIAKRMGVKYVMLVDEAGTVYMTPQMAARVEFNGEKPKIVISDLSTAH